MMFKRDSDGADPRTIQPERFLPGEGRGHRQESERSKQPGESVRTKARLVIFQMRNCVGNLNQLTPRFQIIEMQLKWAGFLTKTRCLPRNTYPE
jgi:hypothetical protein